MSNHVIYDRIWESRKLAKCSLKAALAYPWIYLMADDWGRFEYLPRVIWGRVFGAREDVKSADVTAWLAEYRVVGLLDVYEAGGRQVGQWTSYVGPPPSRRRAATMPARDGTYENVGLKGDSRFKTATRHVQVCSPGNGKEETGNEKRETGEGTAGNRSAANPSLPVSRPGGPEDPEREAAAREVEALAANLAERTRTDPKTWVVRASSIPGGDGRPGKSFEDPRRRGLSVSWLQTTARKLREIRDEAVRPPPL